MADVITTTTLSAYLEDEAILTSTRASEIVDLTNSLIDEEWANPEDPVPARIKMLAYTVAARAYYNKPGRGPLESLTRSFDDSSRTERYAVTVGEANGHDVFLTDDELALLRGTARRRVGSIRVAVPRTW